MVIRPSPLRFTGRSSILSMGQQVIKILTVWVFAAGAAGADTWDEEQFARLASGDDEEIQQAVTDLAARYDQAHYALMRGLFSGEVYRWSEREVQSGLVLIGDEEMDEYGDSIAPLFTSLSRARTYPRRGRDAGQGLALRYRGGRDQSEN